MNNATQQASPQPSASSDTGHQRHSIERLDRWRALDYGMFIHFGLATFTSHSGNRGVQSISNYQPTELDVDQWVQVARDAGMRYVILTAKHTRDGGFSMWHTRHSDYSVAHSPVKTDVIGKFIEACEKHGVKPAIYLGGDLYNVPDGMIGSPHQPFFYVNRAFMDLTLAQLDELLTGYGPIEEVWFDGPHKYGLERRWELTHQIASHQPDTIVAMNGTWEDDGRQPRMKPFAWPSDLIVIEAGVPPIWGGNNWRTMTWDPLGRPVEAPLPYYLPVENCTIAHEGSGGWWWGPNCRPRSVKELLGIRLLCHTRNANCVFNVTPDTRGKIPDDQVKALLDTGAAWDRL